VLRARTFADAVDELASLVERYQLLAAHAADPPGRTTARRDRMRIISARFPGALRELDCIGVEGVARRGAQAQGVLQQALESGDVVLATWPTWMRGFVALQPRLREVLRIKRFLATRGLRAGSVDARRALAAWYDQPAGGGDPVDYRAPSDDYLRRVGAPPRGQVQQVAYEDAAHALGMTPEELKECLYPNAPDETPAFSDDESGDPTSDDSQDDDHA